MILKQVLRKVYKSEGMMELLSLSRKGFGILWALISLTAVFLAAGWLLARPAQAATGLTVEVMRNGNLLMATAATVQDSEVVDESWRWVISEECEVATFEDDNKGGEGWTVELNSKSGNKHYCFYVEDSDDRQAVAGIKVAYPVVRVEQNNDQLAARVVNAAEENILIDEDSWEWFRYNHITNSRFGCQSQHFGLDEEGLQAAAAAAEEQQEADFGSVRIEVYATQRDAYLSGQGSTASLTAEDQGLSYCFRVTDTAGITNVWHMEVGEVVVSRLSAAKQADDSGDGTSANIDGQAEDEGSGQVGVNPEGSDDGAQTGEGDNDEGGNNNWIRYVGFAFLAVAVIVGAVMLIRSSQLKDNEKEE